MGWLNMPTTNADYVILPAGTRVYSKRALDYQPYGVIPPGALGTVVDNGAPFGVEVMFDEIQPGLGPWHNCALLVGEEALSALRVIPPTCAACPSFPHTSQTLREAIEEMVDGTISPLAPLLACG
jgi:hypothetical protein